jgi:hypothetical protein
MHSSHGREQFIGVWKLISCERRHNSGRIDYPYGEHPAGRITYDRAGRMSAQLMNPARPVPAYTQSAEGIRDAAPEDMRNVLSGYLAYYGTFEVDEPAQAVTHRVESCLNPAWIGTTLRRSYEFAAGRLTLSAANGESTNVLVWEREPD